MGLAWFVLFLIACGGDAPAEPATDAGRDAGRDSDATADGRAADSAVDAAPDAAPEAGPHLTPPAAGCPAYELTLVDGVVQVRGHTAFATARLPTSCRSLRQPNLTYAFTVPRDGRYQVRLIAGFQAYLSVRTGCEEGEELTCVGDGPWSGERSATVTASAGTRYILVVEGLAPGPFELSVGPAETCDEDGDEDGDGLSGCSDPDCQGAPPCNEVLCQDGEDGDADGRTDCDDPDCLPGCEELDCSDGVDNDGDGRVDCADANCSLLCPLEECANGIDDTGNGLVDCEDPTCPPFECGEQLCGDGLDNDSDGKADCLDDDCQLRRWALCKETACDDGVDNDGNGDTDCDDWDCEPTPTCCDPTCPLADLGSALGPGVAEGSAAALCDNIAGELCSEEPGEGQDASFTFTAPETGTYVFDTLGSDYLITLALYYTASCEEASRRTELACDADDGGPIARVPDDRPFTSVRSRLAVGQTVLVVINSTNYQEAGNYQLNIQKL